MGDKRKIVRGQEDMNPHPYSVFNVVLIVSFVKECFLFFLTPFLVTV
jgi:hypothetical protein